MGKRKLHAASFYQCEWTGLPMRQPYCYMPSWSPTDKLLRKGSYCNWESVVAHADYLVKGESITADEHTRIMEHIEGVVGTVVKAAPHYEALNHLKGALDPLGYHKLCSEQPGPITAVKITAQGEVIEIILQPNEVGRFIFDDYMHKPYNHLMGLATFHSTRKKTGTKQSRDLSVWYYPTKELPHNATASNVFKMQLYSDILLVQQSSEASFMPRDRYVGFTKTHYDDMFCKRRKRGGNEPPTLSPEGYEELKLKMQETLNTWERDASKTARDPKQLAKATPIPPSDGRQMAEAARERAIRKDLECLHRM